jgi:hypothetical protein
MEQFDASGETGHGSLAEIHGGHCWPRGQLANGLAHPGEGKITQLGGNRVD